MFRISLLIAVVVLLVAGCAEAKFMAGAARVDCTMPVGVPLAGFNHGERRVPKWPIPVKTEYTTFMTPSVGHLDPTWCRALIIDDGTESFAFMSIDAIGSDGTLRNMSWNIAKEKGLRVPFSNYMTHGSHSHSGPGAITPELLWALAPATDLLVPKAQELMANGLANALLQAQANMAEAVFGIGSDLLYNVTVNRRGHESPFLHPWSIDPNLGIMRVDRPNGDPVATVWNFAIHGVCWGPEQMNSSADIMGGVNKLVELDNLGVSLFINADAGDIDPGAGVCDGKPNYKGAPIIADKIKAVRASIKTTEDVQLKGVSKIVDFGRTNMNITLSRWSNCTKGGELDICSICEALHCEINPHLGPEYIETQPQFNAVRFTVDGVHTLLVTLPGEPLSELGNQLRSDSAALGFQHTLLAGYSNNHMGYFCTPDEYDVGGYESTLTLWGINTAVYVRGNATALATLIRP